MFAGIVQGVCKVAAIRPAEQAVRLEIELEALADGLSRGASVAINGACLTVAELDGARAAFDVVPETCRLTTLGRLAAGDLVNVERALRLGDPVDGHLVQGHVDGVGRVVRIDRGGEYKLWVRPPRELLGLIVRKGSIALDGTSLTVVDVTAEDFSVALIPVTLEQTVLGRRRVGDEVNIETDILARLVARQLAAMRAGDALTLDKLRESGFA